VADEGLFAGQAEPTGAGSAGDDEGAGAEDVAAGDIQLDGALGEIGAEQVAVAKFCAKAGRLFVHVVDELGALDAFGPAGKIFDERGDGQLAAGLMAFQNEGLEVSAGGVDGGGESGTTGAEDDGIADI